MSSGGEFCNREELELTAATAEEGTYRHTDDNYSHPAFMLKKC